MDLLCHFQRQQNLGTAPHVQLLIVHVWARNGTLVYRRSDGRCCAVVGLAPSRFSEVDEWNESRWKDEKRGEKHA